MYFKREPLQMLQRASRCKVCISQNISPSDMRYTIFLKGLAMPTEQLTKCYVRVEQTHVLWRLTLVRREKL